MENSQAQLGGGVQLTDEENELSNTDLRPPPKFNTTSRTRLQSAMHPQSAAARRRQKELAEEEDEELQDQLDEINERVDRAAEVKQQRLQSTRLMSATYNSRATDRLEQKHFSDQSKVKDDYRDYITRAKKLQDRLNEKQKADEAIHHFNLQQKAANRREKMDRVIAAEQEREKKRLQLERKNKIAEGKMGSWKNSQAAAVNDEKLIMAEISREDMRVKNLNQMRCKRMQGDYKRHLVDQLEVKQKRKEDLQASRERQTNLNLKQNTALRDQMIATAVQGRRLQEPVGMETRHKEFLLDERKRKAMLQEQR